MFNFINLTERECAPASCVGGTEGEGEEEIFKEILC